MGHVRVGLVGATGYLGSELLRILARHPRAEVSVLASSKQAGKGLAEVLPEFERILDLPLVPLAPEAFADVDVVFLATPHGVARALAPALLQQGNRVVDLSGDHRLAQAESAQRWYGEAPADDIRAKTVYGLPELNRRSIRDARLVANPGCYPTASALAVAPLVAAGAVEPAIVIDAKSGVSGAGREPTAQLHFPEMNESMRPYKVGDHRHQPEIAQTLAAWGGAAVDVVFTPHIVPMNRGIVATAYLRPVAGGPPADLAARYAKFYEAEPFVRVVKHDPDTRHVRGTNFADVRAYANGRTVVAVAAIDNLVKGGSGQAIQNMNIMFGLPETEGLFTAGVGP
ncbi:MAG TPA: N-acetyl-gamma-glutamyl-phosphate reductase [Candidatus Thermoplasmatota archaeon]|nr:N-acetyl-gamma-glutamyl-phosphate reductase [Candidatus Thermoplasmatota archaeon]